MEFLKSRRYMTMFAGIVSFCSICTVIYIGIVTERMKHSNMGYRKCDVFDSNSSSVFKIPLQKTKLRDFQPVSNRTDMYVYSAYYEGKDKIRLIGLSFNKTNPLLCLLRYWNTSEGTETVRVVAAYVASLHQWMSDKYTSVYYLCYLCGFDVPDAVTITTDLNNISNIVPVQTIGRGNPPQRQYTMCLSPFYGEVSELRFVEWLELNQILGVEKIIIYEHGISESMLKLLNHYTREGVVELFPWIKSRFINGTLLHVIGQLGALNDCLYRTKGRSKYISATDFDEFIIPQYDNDCTWSDMMKRLPKESAVYMFRNTFFRRYPNISVDNTPPAGLLITESLTYKDDRVFPPEERSKLICRTDYVVTLDIHEINALSKGNQYVVPVDTGLLHHYRQNLPESVYTAQKLKVPKTVTNFTRTHKYVKSLRERVWHFSRMFNIYYNPNRLRD